MGKASKAYDDQKSHARERGIPWAFSYAEWLEMWLESGKWPERGRKTGQYCMCRYADVGAYSKNNCFIGKTDDNQQERWQGRRKLESTTRDELARYWLDHNLTQRAVAEIFGVDQSYVSKAVTKFKKENHD